MMDLNAVLSGDGAEPAVNECWPKAKTLPETEQLQYFAAKQIL